MSTEAIQYEGKSFPLGATLGRGGANFSVFARHSRVAQLLLFDRVDDPKPSRVIDLDPRTNRTYHYWHVFVPGVTAGQLYGYRVASPFNPAEGLRFDPNKVLLDPYAKCIARPRGWSREAAQRPGDNAATALKSVVVDPSAYDWEGDAPLGRSFAKTIIYEMHVGGFTRNPNSGVSPAKRGTYVGLIDKIPYLQDLGVSAVVKLPRFGGQLLAWVITAPLASSPHKQSARDSRDRSAAGPGCTSPR
jgi:isoamylase